MNTAFSSSTLRTRGLLSTRLLASMVMTGLVALAGVSTVHAADAATGQKAATSVSTTDIKREDVAGDRTRSTDAKALDPVAEKVRGRFAARFGGMPVTSVVRTPYGVFEVQLGMDLVYTDEDVSWVMEGPLIDAATRRDVTAERLEKLSAIDFADLPKELAVKQVKGDGSRQIAVFEDPNCGYCKQFHKTLESVDNITVYSYLFPILSPDSTEKARDIWCSADQAKTWKDWMVRGKTPAKATCDAPTEQVLALGKKLMLRGTPAIFFADGTRSAGALPLEALEKRLK